MAVEKLIEPLPREVVGWASDRIKNKRNLPLVGVFVNDQRDVLVNTNKKGVKNNLPEGKLWRFAGRGLDTTACRVFNERFLTEICDFKATQYLANYSVTQAYSSTDEAKRLICIGQMTKESEDSLLGLNPHPKGFLLEFKSPNDIAQDFRESLLGLIDEGVDKKSLSIVERRHDLTLATIDIALKQM